MEHNIKLNDYEIFYLKKHFGNNIKKLQYFRKCIAKDQKDGWNRGSTYVVRTFLTKGGKLHFIQINKHKIDLYIKNLELYNR